MDCVLGEYSNNDTHLCCAGELLPAVFVGKNTQGNYGVVSCIKVLEGSVSDLMVTAVCLQRGLGQVEIC